MLMLEELLFDRQICWRSLIEFFFPPETNRQQCWKLAYNPVPAEPLARGGIAPFLLPPSFFLALVVYPITWKKESTLSRDAVYAEIKEKKSKRNCLGLTSLTN